LLELGVFPARAMLSVRACRGAMFGAAVDDGPLQLDYVHAGGVAVGCDNALWEESVGLEERLKSAISHAAA
jgi:hypothetical protein